MAKTKTTEAKKKMKKMVVEDDALDIDLGDIPTFEEVRDKLLQRAKENDNFIDQSEIFDAFRNYSLDDDSFEELIDFFHSQGVATE